MDHGLFTFVWEGRNGRNRKAGIVWVHEYIGTWVHPAAKARKSRGVTSAGSDVHEYVPAAAQTPEHLHHSDDQRG